MLARFLGERCLCSGGVASPAREATSSRLPTTARRKSSPARGKCAAAGPGSRVAATERTGSKSGEPGETVGGSALERQSLTATCLPLRIAFIVSPSRCAKKAARSQEPNQDMKAQHCLCRQHQITSWSMESETVRVAKPI